MVATPIYSEERNAGSDPRECTVASRQIGFTTSWRLWAAGPLYERMWNIIDSQETRDRGIYNTEVVLDDFQRFRRGEADLSTKIFNLVQFELWARQINQDRMSPTDRSYTVEEETY